MTVEIVPVKAEQIPAKVKVHLTTMDSDGVWLTFTIPEANAFIAQLSKAVVEAQK